MMNCPFIPDFDLWLPFYIYAIVQSAYAPFPLVGKYLPHPPPLPLLVHTPITFHFLFSLSTFSSHSSSFLHLFSSFFSLFVSFKSSTFRTLPPPLLLSPFTVSSYLFHRVLIPHTPCPPTSSPVSFFPFHRVSYLFHCVQLPLSLCQTSPFTLSYFPFHRVLLPLSPCPSSTFTVSSLLFHHVLLPHTPCPTSPSPLYSFPIPRLSFSSSFSPFELYKAFVFFSFNI